VRRARELFKTKSDLFKTSEGSHLGSKAILTSVASPYRAAELIKHPKERELTGQGAFEFGSKSGELAVVSRQFAFKIGKGTPEPNAWGETDLYRQQSETAPADARSRLARNPPAASRGERREAGAHLSGGLRSTDQRSKRERTWLRPATGPSVRLAPLCKGSFFSFGGVGFTRSGATFVFVFGD